MNKYGHNIDSKFRFVIVASKRAKQLLRGSKPKLRSKSRNLIRIAQQEVSAGTVDFEILPVGKEDFPEAEDRVLVGGVGIGAEDVSETESAGADKEELAGADVEEAAANEEESAEEGEEEEGEKEKEEET
ncbi:MAG: DNA-directed RNA polymerase subunit omega [Candidatus Aminicenantes bacterium]|nr:DNA-directed RNA polymerase subunit omega [Candidatus Aminicenantes bacterium]